MDVEQIVGKYEVSIRIMETFMHLLLSLDCICHMYSYFIPDLHITRYLLTRNGTLSRQTTLPQVRNSLVPTLSS